MPDPASLVSVTFYEPHELDLCNFVETSEDDEAPESPELPCGQPAVTCLITTRRARARRAAEALPCSRVQAGYHIDPGTGVNHVATIEYIAGVLDIYRPQAVA